MGMQDSVETKNSGWILPLSWLQLSHHLLQTAKGWLKNYLAFCLQNVQSLRDFCGQIMPSYFCTIPK